MPHPNSCSKRPHADACQQRKRPVRPSSVDESRSEKDPTVTASRSRPATTSRTNESYASKAAATEEKMEWRNPVSGRLFHIDLRTGHSVAIGAKRSSTITVPAPLYTTANSTNLRKRLDLALEVKRRAIATTDEFEDPSLDAALACMPSPTVTVPADCIYQSRYFNSSGSRPGLTLLQSHSTETEDEGRVARHFPQQTIVELAITRSELQQAKVLDQVDGKFILCCSASTMSSIGLMLFCVDQHAADERYRLERRLQQYIEDCIAGNAAHPLPSFLTLTVTVQQRELITADSAVLSGLNSMGWSIRDVVLIHATLGHAQVDLSGIPYILTEKSLTRRGAVRDMGLLESAFANCLDEAKSWSRAVSCVDRNESAWLALSRAMPCSLMSVVKSAACRSAIMFNDPLSREASERLVRRLGECSFPFQCAHGRPSLVPLCEIRTVQASHTAEEGKFLEQCR